MSFPKINGLVAAPFTPMHPDGSINVSIIPTYHDFLKRNGVAGVFICGSTGEGPSMTLLEKKAVAEAWAHANKGDDHFKVILFVGGTCLEDAKELARHASAIGLNGIYADCSQLFQTGQPPTTGSLLYRCGRGSAGSTFLLLPYTCVYRSEISHD